MHNVANVTHCRAGQQLVSEDDHDTGLYIVLDGRVSVQMPNGERFDATKHDYFAHASLAGDGRALARANAVEDTELLHIPRKGFAKLTRRLPKLGRQLFQNLAEELCRNLVDHYVDSAPDSSDTQEWPPC